MSLFQGFFLPDATERATLWKAWKESEAFHVRQSAERFFSHLLIQKIHIFLFYQTLSAPGNKAKNLFLEKSGVLRLLEASIKGHTTERKRREKSNI